MWYLKHIKTGTEYYIFVDEENVVGRKDSFILIADDLSVSRKHAILYVKHLEENLGDPVRKSKFFVKDGLSKYGTFKNGIRLGTAEEILDVGDILKFGQLTSEFRVCYTPLVVTTSCLEISAKRQLKKTILKLGGHFVTEWRPSCSHLVMSDVKVTIKALCCLVSLKPIVLPQYFDVLKENLKSLHSIAEVKEFLPPIGENLIDKEEVSFHINVERKKLFKDKIFMFLEEKQFKKLHLGITLAGGKALILSEENIRLDAILRAETCVLQPPKESLNEANSKLVNQVKSLLKQKNWRMIPEPDVGLAVAYCSTEVFCNPVAMNALCDTQKLYSQTLSQQEVYVPDTQTESSREARQVFSFEEGISTTKSARITIEDSQEVVHASKRKQTDVSENSCFKEPCHPDAKKLKRDASSLNLTSFLSSETVTNTNCLPINHDIENIFEKEDDGGMDEILGSIPAHGKATNEIQNITSETAVSMNGRNADFPIQFSSRNKDKSTSNENDENLPENMVKIEFVSLVKKKSTILETRPNLNIKNFKHFKKVLPVGARALPRIIGAHELFAYDKHNSRHKAEVDDFPEELLPTKRAKREFDWDSQT